MRNSAFDVSPLSDDLLGKLYSAGPQHAADAVAGLSEPVRASIAAFCYARAHLQEIGLAIAAGCGRNALLDAAGRSGDVLFALSRRQVAAPPPSRKRPVTLATGAPMRAFTVIEGGLSDAEDDVDDIEDIQDVEAVAPIADIDSLADIEAIDDSAGEHAALSPAADEASAEMPASA
jgi:hypothetical protein